MNPYPTAVAAVHRAVRELRATMVGSVHLPGDPGYDAERLGWNRSVDSRPAFVAVSAGPADVRAAVRAAREHDLAFAVQSTGHGAVSPADGGLLLKTSSMATVAVDPAAQTVRVGPGVLWDQVIAAAAPYGLAPVSGRCSSVGVTGYTLGGGTGWLSRKHGFAADSLLRAELVTAEGQAVVASPLEHPDLFWALRGGGGNFGVVTAMEFRLFPVASVYGGMSLYAVSRAAETLAAYRDWALEQPDELNTEVLLLKLPPSPLIPEPLRGQRILAIRAFYLGSADHGRRLLAPLVAAAGPPLADGFAVRSFADASAATNGPPAPPMAATQHFDLFHDVPDDVVDAMVEAAGEGVDSPFAFVELRNWGGAMARPGPDAGPTGHPDAPFSVNAVAAHGQAYPRDTVDGFMSRLATRLAPHATGGSFLNLLLDPTKTRSAFTEANYAGLLNAKRTWDPGNFFRGGHNIPPVWSYIESADYPKGTRT